MKCPKCDRPLRVTHTYGAGGSAKVHRAVCECGAVAVIVSEIFDVDPTHGNGAAAVAAKIKAEAAKRS